MPFPEYDYSLPRDGKEIVTGHQLAKILLSLPDNPVAIEGMSYDSPRDKVNAVLGHEDWVYIIFEQFR